MRHAVGLGSGEPQIEERGLGCHLRDRERRAHRPLCRGTKRCRIRYVLRTGQNCVTQPQIMAARHANTGVDQQGRAQWGVSLHTHRTAPCASCSATNRGSCACVRVTGVPAEPTAGIGTARHAPSAADSPADTPISHQRGGAGWLGRVSVVGTGSAYCSPPTPKLSRATGLSRSGSRRREPLR